MHFIYRAIYYIIKMIKKQKILNCFGISLFATHFIGMLADCIIYLKEEFTVGNYVKTVKLKVAPELYTFINEEGIPERKAGGAAVIGTGGSNFPNQINNRFN